MKNKSNDPYAVAEILSKDAGYVVEICGMYVCKMRNGKYHVVSERGAEPIEEVFDDPWKAAVFFCDQRENLKLGFDFQQKSAKIELPIVSERLGSETFIG